MEESLGFWDEGLGLKNSRIKGSQETLRGTKENDHLPQVA